MAVAPICNCWTPFRIGCDKNTKNCKFGKKRFFFTRVAASTVAEYMKILYDARSRGKKKNVSIQYKKTSDAEIIAEYYTANADDQLSDARFTTMRKEAAELCARIMMGGPSCFALAGNINDGQVKNILEPLKQNNYKMWLLEINASEINETMDPPSEHFMAQADYVTQEVSETRANTLPIVFTNVVTKTIANKNGSVNEQISEIKTGILFTKFHGVKNAFLLILFY